MIQWDDLINSLGKAENSAEFSRIKSLVKDVPYITSDPEEHNDPINHTTYFKFLKTGIEIGFRQNKIHHVHFFFYNENGYSPYLGNLLSNITGKENKNKIVRKLGPPSSEGGGNIDMLIGYINSWIKYNLGAYSVHIQFNKQDLLCRATLIKND